MKYTENALNIFTVKSYEEKGREKGKINNIWIIENLQGNESVDKIVSLLNKNKPRTTIIDFENRRKRYEQQVVEKLKDFCDGFVAFGDDNFPKHRGRMKNGKPPVFFYYKGNIDLLSINNKNISVIGLLNPDRDIEEREREIVDEFVKNGAAIVSGLAFGCDSIAHTQALDSGGKTVAILPSPLSNILPKRNKYLADKIIEEGGLLVTEYGNDIKESNIRYELSSRYIERDRLQALFCDTIVLAASFSKNSEKRLDLKDNKKLDSGARLAMGFAMDYNIPRAVMYDENLDKDNPMFDLNRELIEEQKNITVINSKNSKKTIEKIMSVCEQSKLSAGQIQLNF